MNDLVQTAINNNISESYNWPNLAQFNAGGIQETAKILSMQDFLRAEDNLGHISGDIDANAIKHNAEVLHLFRADYGKGHELTTCTELFNAHLTRIDGYETAHDHTVFNYSLKDTSREQNGASTSDADISTAGGYRKNGILDSDAYKIDEKRRHAGLRFIQILNEQELLTQYLVELGARIEELEKEISVHNEEIAEMEEMLNVLDDGNINANSGAGRARRAKLQSWAKEKGVDLDKFKKEDGSIDQDKLREYMVREQQNTIDRRDVAKAELEERQEEYRIAENRLEEITQEKRTMLAEAEASGDVEQIEQAKIALRDSGTKGRSEFNQLLSENEQLEMLANEAGVDRLDITMDDFGSRGASVLDNLLNGFEDATMSPAKLSDNNVTYGSFSGNDLNAANDASFSNIGNIENTFNAKSNYVLKTTELDVTQSEETYAYNNFSSKSTYTI